MRTVVVLTLLLAALPCAAQKKAEAEARELYKKGMTHYQIGELDQAIDEFKRAYELTSAPGLLFNIGQCHRLKKGWEQALYFYRMYLRLSPDAPEKVQVQSLIEEAEAKLAEEKRAAPPPPEPAPAPAPIAPPPVTTPPVTTTTTPPLHTHWRVEVAAFGALAGLGVASLAAAVAVGVRASSASDQLARDSAQGVNSFDAGRQALYSDGQRSATAATALYAIGGVLLAGGVVAGVLGFRDRARERRALRVTAGGLACAF